MSEQSSYASAPPRRDSPTTTARGEGRPPLLEGNHNGRTYRFYDQSALSLPQCADDTIALTLTSPPYWNAIDYNIHAAQGKAAWHRTRAYGAFGATLDDYLNNLSAVFREVLRATLPGGFCAIVVGTILHKRKHYPVPMRLTESLLRLGWEFHQDIIWNKVTGGVKRAGSFIQHPRAGYYYPNIMTEYILVFRKPGPPRRGAAQALHIDTLFKHDIANNIWHIAPIPPGQIDHPCPFPQELVRRLVRLYSDSGDRVLDPFLGSGQTALVALHEGRHCVGYDIEPRYLHLAKARLAEPPAVRGFQLMARFDKLAVEREGEKMNLSVEHSAFATLKTHCRQQAADEYVKAIEEVLYRYNTTTHENRFIVGGALEVFTACLLRSVGIWCYEGDPKNPGSLLLEQGKILSIKGSFTGGISDVKLMNKLGDGHRQWAAATLFVVSGVGIVYGDPTNVDPKHIKQVSDGLVLKKAGIEELASQSENILRINIPQKKRTGNTQKTVSRDIAYSMLKDLPLLSEHHPSKSKFSQRQI
ncbi:MAG: site-specific DNA-methyltransferase [Rhodobacteraceae bacterium]|nr:site-specific DNA-methyltransferase [Paracoccaceae bacterium]